MATAGRAASLVGGRGARRPGTPAPKLACVGTTGAPSTTRAEVSSRSGTAITERRTGSAPTKTREGTAVTAPGSARLR